MFVVKTAAIWLVLTLLMPLFRPARESLQIRKAAAGSSTAKETEVKVRPGCSRTSASTPMRRWTGRPHEFLRAGRRSRNLDRPSTDSSTRR